MASFDALPHELQGAAFDAAVAAANEHAVRFGNAKPTHEIDARSLRVAEQWIRANGGIFGPSKRHLVIDADAFAAQMRKLESYMRRERIFALTVPVELDVPPPTSLIVGAAEALFTSAKRT
jgi:hypothetical protein